MPRLTPRLSLMLLLMLALLFSFRGWPSADGQYFLAEAETFFEQGQLGRESITTNEAAYYRLGEDGRYYGQSNEAAMVLSLVPFVAVGKAFAAIAPAGYDALAPPFVAGLHSLLFTLLAAWLLVAIARQAGMAERSAWLAAILFVLSTPMLHYSGRLFRDPIVVALSLWALLALLRWLAKPERREGILFALSMLFLMLTRPPNALLLLVVALITCWRSDAPKAKLLSFGLLALLVGFALRWLWSSTMTEASVTGSAEVASIWSKLFLNINGSEGLSAAGDAQGAESAWWVPLSRLAGMLISPGAGLLFTAPLVLFGGWQAWRLRKTDGPLAGLALWLLLGSLVGFSFYAAWFSGSWGVRYLLPAMALPCLFAADGLRRLAPILRNSVIVLAIFIGVVGTVVNDRPTVNHAPSFDASVTRLDQVWQPAAMPLWHHAKRALTPSFEGLEARALKQGWPSARRGVLKGYVLWWAIAYRAGVLAWLMLLAPLAMLLGIALLARSLLRCDSVTDGSGN